MKMTIACALRWGVALVEVFSTGHDTSYMGNISGAGHTGGWCRTHRRTVLIQGRNCEKCRIVALIVIL